MNVNYLYKRILTSFKYPINIQIVFTIVKIILQVLYDKTLVHILIIVNDYSQRKVVIFMTDQHSEIRTSCKYSILPVFTLHMCMSIFCLVAFFIVVSIRWILIYSN